MRRPGGGGRGAQSSGRTSAANRSTASSSASTAIFVMPASRSREIASAIASGGPDSGPPGSGPPANRRLLAHQARRSRRRSRPAASSPRGTLQPRQRAGQRRIGERGQDRRPAVAEAERPRPGGGDVPTEDDRHRRRRRRIEPGRLPLVDVPSNAGRRARPDRPQRGDVLVHPHPAARERDAERLEFLLHPAAAEPAQQPPGSELLDRREHLAEHDRVPVRARPNTWSRSGSARSRRPRRR